MMSWDLWIREMGSPTLHGRASEQRHMGCERSTGVRPDQGPGLSAGVTGGPRALPSCIDLLLCGTLRNLNSLLSGEQ